MPKNNMFFSFKYSLTSQTFSFDDGYRNVMPGPDGNEFALDKFLGYILSAEREAFNVFIDDAKDKDDLQVIVTMTDNPESEKDGAQCSVLFKQISSVENNEFAGVIINLSTILPGGLLYKDLERFVTGISQIREITHDLNNQFQIITGFGSALQEDVTTPDMQESADNVVAAVTKAISYNHKLRSFFPPKLRKPLYLPLKNFARQKDPLVNEPVTANVKDTASFTNAAEKQKISSSAQDDTTKAAIMVVDDEPLVRKFLCEMIKRLGHDVSGFGSSVEALEAANDIKTPFSLAIIDMNLPDTSAEDLFASLKSAQPDLKIILISGDPHGDLAEQLIAKGACGYLQKPATVKSLAEAVNNAFSLADESVHKIKQQSL